MDNKLIQALKIRRHGLSVLAGRRTERAARRLIVPGVTVLVATLFIMVGISRPTVVPSQQASTLASPTPKPVAPIPVARTTSSDCPEMDNPGGRMDWRPSDKPGPTLTNGEVIVPALAVQAPIVRVGFDADNLMVVPRNARDVGWLDRGGIPGKTNNVVLAGHIRYSGVAGSFGRIGELRPGSHIVLKVDKKHVIYEVEWNCSFDFNTNRAEQIMGYTYEPSLTLISCGGVFDSGARTHNKRIAVRAKQVKIVSS